MIEIKKRTKVFVGVSAVIACIGVVSVLLTNDLTKFDVDSVKATVRSYGALGPLVYMGIYAVGTVLFVPGAPLTLAGGALFGPWFGTLYTVIGATIGAVFAFLVTRFFRTSVTLPDSQSALIQKVRSYDAEIAKHGFVTMLFLRFVPLFPFNGLNFALGLTSVTFRDYFFGTLLGIIPGTFAYTYFGDSLASLNITKVLIGLGIIVLISLVGHYFYKRHSASHT